jgi:hypothetical protein
MSQQSESIRSAQEEVDDLKVAVKEARKAVKDARITVKNDKERLDAWTDKYVSSMSDEEKVEHEKREKKLEERLENSRKALNELLKLQKPKDIEQMTKCPLAFYNNIAQGRREGEFLVFQDEIPASKLSKLYVRDSYIDISSCIRKIKEGKVIVTGTPGIGKSWFLVYLLWRLVRKNQRVLFIYHPDMIYYDSENKVFYVDKLPSKKDVKFWSADLWCLFDANFKDKEDLKALRINSCRFVLSMSPRRDLINDLKKDPEPSIYYMPIWKEDELKIIKPFYSEDIEWADRFAILGGVPRLIFKSRRDPKDILSKACAECNLRKCVNFVRKESLYTDKIKAVHALIHIHADAPYDKPINDYATQAALDILFESKIDNDELLMHDLIKSCSKRPMAAVLCGHIFEDHALKMLAKGGIFEYRQLDNCKSNILPQKLLHIPKSEILQASEVVMNMKEYQLYKPNKPNYPCIDAWMPEVGTFQMTVSEIHSIKNPVRARNDLAKLGEKGNRFFWLIPPENYDDNKFTKQPPFDIDQYVVRIPHRYERIKRKTDGKTQMQKETGSKKRKLADGHS